jgi:hypothetical protein
VKKAFFFFSILFIVGCQSVTFPIVSLNQDSVKLPEASMFLVDSGSLYETPRYKIGPAIYRDINNSGLFENVTVNNTYSPLKIYVDFRDTTDTSGVTEFAKMMLSAVTLFLVPVTKDYSYEVKYNLVFLDKNIKSYSYSLHEDSWVHMFLTMPAEVQEVAAKSMTSQFLSDLSKDNLSIIKPSNAELTKKNGI